LTAEINTAVRGCPERTAARRVVSICQ